MLDHIKPENPNQKLQLGAAKEALRGEFKESIALMLKSMGATFSNPPEWISPPPIIHAGMGGQAENIGNIFLSKRLEEGVENGEIASAILAGHYGYAVYLMALKERMAHPQEELPEDIEELTAYLEAHPTIIASNDSFIPSWLK